MSGVTIANGVVATDPANGGSFTDPSITGGSINGTHIGNITPSDGAFTTLNANSANVFGPVVGTRVDASTNSQIASISNTGVSLGASSNWAQTTYFDSTRAADGKTADAVFQSGSYSLRFKNDAGNNATVWLQGVGTFTAITAINSNSGSGIWTHTGAMQTVGNFYASASGGNGIRLNGASSGSSPTLTTDGVNADVGLIISTKGSGAVVIERPTSVSSTFSAQGLRVTEGSNAKQGTATLVAGTVTVANTSVTANSRIFLTTQSLGTVADPKAIAVTARVAGTSFTIRSADATDTSVIAYEIFEPG